MRSSRLAAFLPFSSVFSASYRTSPPDYLEFPSSVSGLHMVHMVCCWTRLFDAGMGEINRQLSFLKL